MPTATMEALLGDPAACDVIKVSRVVIELGRVCLKIATPSSNRHSTPSRTNWSMIGAPAGFSGYSKTKTLDVHDSEYYYLRATTTIFTNSWLKKTSTAPVSRCSWKAFELSRARPPRSPGSFRLLYGQSQSKRKC